MNTVCPGFVPHHIKPNRCRRCFKDIKDHSSSNEVSTSVTLFLPRRRRESVAVAETPQAEEKAVSDQSASFTITETTSLGRRTRQRSSSTSSWFQEKKINEEQKEKIDTLFKNADDSRASYRNVGLSDDIDDKTVDTVAVIRLPETRTRRRFADDGVRTSAKKDAHSPKLDTKSHHSRSPELKRAQESSNKKEDTKPPDLPPKTLDNKLDFTTNKLGNKLNTVKDSENRLKTSTTNTSESDSVNSSSSFRTKTETSPADSVNRNSSFRSKFDAASSDKATKSETSKTETTKTETKPTEKKPWEPKKTVETKFGEVKLKDSKLSEIRARASKFETPASKIESIASKFQKPSTESKVKDTHKNIDSKSSKFQDLKASETKIDSKTKDEQVQEPKPVEKKASDLKTHSIFPYSKSTILSSPTKPSIQEKKKVFSSSEEETESESSDEPTSKSRSVIKPKESEKCLPVPASTKTSAVVANLIVKKDLTTQQESPKKDSTQNLFIIKSQKEQENKIKELQDALEQLKVQLKAKENMVVKLEQEKSDFQMMLNKDNESLERTVQELNHMREQLHEMQSTLEDVRNENKRMKQEVKEQTLDLKQKTQELKQKAQELKDSKFELSKAKQELSKKQDIIPDKNKITVDQMKVKLAQSEALCEELMEENEEIKKEVRDLEQELEELHDNFREDQASEFRGLKKELETATKNCRVLQFKLRKAEKKCELLELDRHSLEDKVREYQAAVRQDVDRSKLKDLERELNLSRNLTASMGKEVKELKEALNRAEADNETLRHGCSVTPTSQSRLSPVVKDMSKDYETLSHELSDTMERENDLREQLKFSEEEAKQARRKIGNLEQENETLMLQIKKLTTIVRNKKGDKDDEEEISVDNLKIQMELMEQEMGVLRRKMDEAEKENEGLQAEVKYLQEKVINQPLIELPELPRDAGSPGVYWENKVRLQEYEIRETRKKLIEKDREIERLNTEVQILRKKASKMMVRSRSLDSDLQVDLKRQLQLVEQEASILRQKVNTLDNENEKLTTDNKRMTLRLGKKPPLSSADLLQIDNMELKQKLEDQQRKLETMKEELEKVSSQNPVLIQDYKPRRESLTALLSDNENDLIATLKKRLKSKEEDYQNLQTQSVQLEVENNRINRDYKKLKEALSSKKKPMKAIRDSATRLELRELVSELQDEISELQVTLRGREVTQEGVEDELEKLRKELKVAIKELKQKEDRLQLELDKRRNEKESLKKEIDTHKNRATAAEEQLSQISKQNGAQVDQLRKLQSLKSEKEDAERRAKAAEEALEKKTQRLRDTQEKLNVTTALKEDMARSNRILESQKADLEKEVDEHRSHLVKAEAKAAELRTQVDKTDKDLTSLRKECNQLRNELEEERNRLKQSSDKRQTEVSSVWSREREDLRRQINDLKNRIEQLQHQVTQNEKTFIEKESRLRDEFKRKKEAAVKEAREKGESALELAREEEKILKNKAQELNEKLEKTETSLREANEKCRKSASEYRREKDEWWSERDSLEASVQAEVKKRERAEREAEQQMKALEEEVLLSKERVVAVEREQRRMQLQLEEVDSLGQKVALLEKEADDAKEEYDHLTNKYEQLEEDFVKTKSKLVQEKEHAEANLNKIRKEYNELNFETTSLKESYNAKQDSWIKDKIDLQERVKELNRRLERLKSVEQERRRLQDMVDEKETLIESYKKEEKYLKEEREKLTKRVEDLNKSMDLKNRAWSSISTGDTKLDQQLENLRKDYEGRMSIMSSEISSMQAQIAALAEERDRLKSQLSSAEEMRTGSLKRERARHREEAESARRKVEELRYQLEDVREHLDDAHLENRNLKLQIETDKNSSDIQLLELKSKINQLEEQKLLESARGQTRAIAKTRLELTWEKERAELQHQLSETQKLVAELKVRVSSAESTSEKEKQAMRKQMLDMRSSTDTDRQESRRKMTELHSSLLEIRESHAKLRGLYDRLKKEREILLKEREEWRQRLQTYMSLNTKITEILKDIEKVDSVVAANDKVSSFTLTPEFKDTVKKIKENFIELQKSAEALKEDERLKRTTSFRRAVSAQDMSLNRSQDPIQRWNNPQRVTNYPLAPPSMLIRPPPRQKSLQRKSLSLDHTLTGGSNDQRLKIWESEGESMASTPAGSVISLGGYGYETDSSLPDSEYRYGGITQNRRRYMLRTPMTDSEAPYSSREGSIDPGGSSESVPLASQQQKKSFKDRLKLLRRAKSTDVSCGQKVTSTDDSKDAKQEKEMSLRSKISKVLKKPLGRSLSMESKKPVPALPPKGVIPNVVPNRPTAEKPLSASRETLNRNKSPSNQDEKSRTKKSSKPGFETSV